MLNWTHPQHSFSGALHGNLQRSVRVGCMDICQIESEKLHLHYKNNDVVVENEKKCAPRISNNTKK